MTAARVIVAVAAVAVIGWLAVMERDERLQASGIEAAEERAYDRAEADFRRARVLNPDATPDLGLALVYQATGRADEAVAAVEDVLRREPESRAAWGLLRSLSRGRDPEAERRAEAEMRRLDPLNAARTGRAEPR